MYDNIIVQINLKFVASAKRKKKYDVLFLVTLWAPKT